MLPTDILFAIVPFLDILKDRAILVCVHLTDDEKNRLLVCWQEQSYNTIHHSRDRSTDKTATLTTYLTNGRIHRWGNLPAILSRTRLEYYWAGRKHRQDGPAVIRFSSIAEEGSVPRILSREWWSHGIKIADDSRVNSSVTNKKDKTHVANGSHADVSHQVTTR